jgi:hypothetical protein
MTLFATGAMGMPVTAFSTIAISAAISVTEPAIRARIRAARWLALTASLFE